jgi:hypothetical protein
MISTLKGFLFLCACCAWIGIMFGSMLGLNWVIHHWPFLIKPIGVLFAVALISLISMHIGWALFEGD